MSTPYTTLRTKIALHPLSTIPAYAIWKHGVIGLIHAAPRKNGVHNIRDNAPAETAAEQPNLEKNVGLFGRFAGYSIVEVPA